MGIRELTEEQKKRRRSRNRKMILLSFLIILFASPYVFDQLDFITIEQQYLQWISTATVILFSMLMANIILKLTEQRVFKFLEEEDVEIEQRIFITKLYKFLIYTIVITVILGQLGFSFSNITLFLGLITTGLAFAVRDILLSYFIWLILLLKKPYRIGDYVQFGKESGTIIRIGTFYMTIQPTTEWDRMLIKVPLRNLLSDSMIDYGSFYEHLDTVSLPLRMVPPDTVTLMAVLKEDLSNRIENARILSAALRFERVMLYVDIRYIINRTHLPEIRNMIFQIMDEHLHDYLLAGRSSSGEDA